MASSIFDYNNSFWQWLSRLTDLFGLSLCWLLCSLPLLTIGAATTALYDGVYHGIRRGESPVYVRFFKTFVRELKTATLATLPALGLGAVCLLLRQVTRTMAAGGDPVAGLLLYGYPVLFCLPLAVWLLAMALLSRFDFRAGALLKTAARLTMARLPSAMAVAILTALAVRVMLWWYFSLAFLPALTALAASLFVERIFRPWLEGQGEA